MTVGYSAPKPGETFLKMGVGVLRKKDVPPSALQHLRNRRCRQVDERPTADSIEFSQSLDDRGGYASIGKPCRSPAAGPKS